MVLIGLLLSHACSILENLQWNVAHIMEYPNS